MSEAISYFKKIGVIISPDWIKRSFEMNYKKNKGVKPIFRIYNSEKDDGKIYCINCGRHVKATKNRKYCPKCSKERTAERNRNRKSINKNTKETIHNEFLEKVI
jgi:Zn finger protein HypA/HybF involved in hydrogenase expression